MDLSAIYGSYERRDGRGQAAYHPVLMIRVLLYGYCTGRVSSRQIERCTHEDVAFRYLAANQHPDHDTVAAFRKEHLEALAGLFLQTLELCREAGLVKAGAVILDGTKVAANASRRQSHDQKELAQEQERLGGSCSGCWNGPSEPTKRKTRATERGSGGTNCRPGWRRWSGGGKGSRKPGRR